MFKKSQNFESKWIHKGFFFSYFYADQQKNTLLCQSEDKSLQTDPKKSK